MRIEIAAPGNAIRMSKVKPVGRENIIKTFGVYILAAALIAFSLSFFLWTRVAVVTTGYKMSELSEKHDILLKENGELKIQFETVVTPKNLERMGNKLGLKYPKQSQVMPVREDVKETKE